MTKNDDFVPVFDDDGKIIAIGDNRHWHNQITNIPDVIRILNEQRQTIKMWCKRSKKITKLLEENTKPTTTTKPYSEEVYLDIDIETKRCKYEDTVICNKCAYYSTYFLNCRLMMGDDQYQKALGLGLVKE